MVFLLGTSTAGATRRHLPPRGATALRMRPAVIANGGAQLDSEATVVPAAVYGPPSFVEFHSARVEYDLLLFKPNLVGVAPSGTTVRAGLFDHAPVKKESRFFAPVENAESLDVRRERDRLLLFRGPQTQGNAVALGLAMFLTTTVLSAHAPRPLRRVFDGPVHLGPAVFDGGGMGAGIAARL